MNFYDYFIKQLTERGVFKNQAEEIMEKVMTNNPMMEGRWSERTSNYPENLTNIIWMGIEDEALKYIKENCPQAWFRPMFDKEHPLRKEFEKQICNS